nr:hypothetical protein CFP56_42057 [Quercus suber]
MPRRCCRFLQLYTAIDLLTHDEVSEYRNKFEELIAQDETYRPTPTCPFYVSPLKIAAVLASCNAPHQATVDCPKKTPGKWIIRRL